MKIDFSKRKVHFNVICVTKIDPNGVQVIRHMPDERSLSLIFTKSKINQSLFPMEVRAEFGMGYCPVMDIDTGLNGKAVVIEIYVQSSRYPTWRLYTDTPAVDGVTPEEIRQEAKRCHQVFLSEQAQAPT